MRMSIVEQVYEKLKTAPPEITQEVLDFLEFLEMRRRPKPTHVGSWDDLMGAFATSPAFNGDAVELQRQMRAEWER
jgi:Protein of unknown function (DUF2281)